MPGLEASEVDDTLKVTSNLEAFKSSHRMSAPKHARTLPSTTASGRTRSFQSNNELFYKPWTNILMILFQVEPGLWSEQSPGARKDVLLLRWKIIFSILDFNFSLEGFAVGTFVAGIVSDMYGRKR